MGIFQGCYYIVIKIVLRGDIRLVKSVFRPNTLKRVSVRLKGILDAV